MTAAVETFRVVPHQAASLPELRAADRGVAEALESVLSDNTRPVYATRRAPACPAVWSR